MSFTRTAVAAAALVVAAVSVPALAVADKPGNGQSTGSARVFFPNPVAQLQDQTLTDQDDADYAELQPAYKIKSLTNLDGTGYLVGDWANIRSETGNPAYSATNTFQYNRSQDEFEQVMAYYWVTEGQKYIQSLGFGTTRRPVNMESQDIRINQWGQDNSYSWDKHDVLRFGKGGVDDAEDAEVILHEYAHAIHDSQGVDLQGVEAGGIGEGWGDYFAVTTTNKLAPTKDTPCVADWDSTSYADGPPFCLRRVDTNAHYPENLSATSVHRNGLIWSRALWDVRKALGAPKADTLILESHFSFGTITTMPQAAAIVSQTAQQLYGSVDAFAVRAAFQARGLA